MLFCFSMLQATCKIIHQLKAIAQELNVPVMACVQLKRAGADRPDHRPRLSDLPDYKSIGKDADIILFLYREGYYNRFVEERNISELIIAKDHGGSSCCIGWRNMRSLPI